MEEIKDSAANVVSFAGIGSYIFEVQTGLTILLLITGIILNVMRMRAIDKTKKED